MVGTTTKAVKKAQTSANVGYEAPLWLMTQTLHGFNNAVERKHFVLGRHVSIFLRGLALRLRFS